MKRFNPYILFLFVIAFVVGYWIAFDQDCFPSKKQVITLHEIAVK